MSEAAFKQSTVRWLVGVGVLSFVGALLLSVFGPEMKGSLSVGPDTFSNSAVGHSALAELLDALDIPLVRSRHGSAEKATGDALLVVAEPLDCGPHTPRGRALAGMIEAASTVLLVLPKWHARMSGSNPEWADEIGLRDDAEARAPLRALAKGMDVHRAPTPPGAVPPQTTRWRGLAPTLPLPIVQLVTGRDVRALVETPSGVLLGEVWMEGTRVLVLSDPDILANAGLGQGDNALLVIEAIEELRPRGGVVVIDETIHGHEREPSIWRELFRFPLLLLVLQGVVTLIVLLWAGVGRFGAPQRDAPPLEPGRQALIANTADLLRYRGVRGSALVRYLRGAVHEARGRLHAPTGLGADEIDPWLDRIGERRGTHERLSDLRALVASPRTSAASPAQMLVVASRIHRWRTEILHGPSSRTRPS